jgi:hypothetical protein
MLRSVFYAATYWLPVLLILLIVIARMAAPFPYGGTDYNQTIEESLIAAAKERSDSGDLYVKVDGGDPSADVLADLNSRKLPATFAPWSLRPHYGCPPTLFAAAWWTVQACEITFSLQTSSPCPYGTSPSCA